MMHWVFAAALALSPPTTGVEPPPSGDIMFLPPELRAQLHDRITRPGGSDRQKFDRLLAFAFDPDGLALTYGTTTTQAAAETWRSGQVNCLSFSLLFVALAREAGLRADVQEIDQVLVWYKQDGIVYSASHVNVGVRIDGRMRTVEVSRTPVIARQRPRIVPDRRALAHFYNNRGAELLATGDIAAAHRHMQVSLELDPGFAGSWNNLGVMHLRGEDLRAAERAYLTALDLDPRHGPTLFNTVGLYRRMGDGPRLAVFQRRLEKAQLADPFHQFLLATDAEQRGDPTAAIAHYLRAIRLHRREALFHSGLARSYFAIGDTRRGNRALTRAQALEKANPRDPQVDTVAGSPRVPSAGNGVAEASNDP